MFPEYSDNAMEDSEEEGGEEWASIEPADDLSRVISDAKQDCETEKDRLQFEQMLQDHKKMLYPNCEDGQKKLGSTLELLRWKVENGVTHTVMRVNSANVLDEGLRTGGVGRRMNSKVKSVKQGVY
jgi:hypothetical protein